MRPIKELMQIMLDNVGEINKKCPAGLCTLSIRLEIRGVISYSEERAITAFLEPIIEPMQEERSSQYAFEPGLVEPRRELLEKIISEL